MHFSTKLHDQPHQMLTYIKMNLEEATFSKTFDKNDNLEMQLKCVKAMFKGQGTTAWR